MTATNDLRGTLRIGEDFADAISGAVHKRGAVTIGGKRYLWTSTTAADIAKAFLRRAAKLERKGFGGFEVTA